MHCTQLQSSNKDEGHFTGSFFSFEKEVAFPVFLEENETKF